MADVTELAKALIAELKASLADKGVVDSDSDIAPRSGLTEEDIKKAESFRQLRKDALKEVETELKFERQITALYQDRTNINNLNLETRRKALELEEAEIRTLKMIGQITEEEYIRQVKLLQQREKGIDANERALRLGRDTLKALGVRPAEDSYLGFFYKMDDIGEKMSGFFKGITERGLMLIPDMVTSVIDKFIELSVVLTMAIDSATVGFAKSTQITGKYNKVIESASANLAIYGIQANEVQESLTELVSTNLDFNNLLQEEQLMYAETSALLGHMGYDTAMFNKNTFMLSKTFGKSAADINRYNLGIIKLGKSLSLTGKQMSEAFTSAEETLQVINDTTGREFSKLVQIMDKTGLSMGKIIALANKFDTFETAAQSVGALNAMLGGPYLNAVEMIENTDPSFRLMRTRDALLAAGKSWSTMGVYEKKALASALGLEKVTDLALLLSGQLESLTEQDVSLGMSAEEIAEMEKETASYNTVLEELKSIGMAIAASFAPVVKVIRDVLMQFKQSQGFKDFITKTENFFKNLQSDDVQNFFDTLVNYAMKAADAMGTVFAALTSIGEFMVGHPILSAFAAGGILTGSSIGALGAGLGQAMGGPIGAAIGAGIGKLISSLGSTAMMNVVAGQVNVLGGGTGGMPGGLLSKLDLGGVGARAGALASAEGLAAGGAGVIGGGVLGAVANRVTGGTGLSTVSGLGALGLGAAAILGAVTLPAWGTALAIGGGIGLLGAAITGVGLEAEEAAEPIGAAARQIAKLDEQASGAAESTDENARALKEMTMRANEARQSLALVEAEKQRVAAATALKVAQAELQTVIETRQAEMAGQAASKAVMQYAELSSQAPQTPMKTEIKVVLNEREMGRAIADIPVASYNQRGRFVQSMDDLYNRGGTNP